MMTGNPEKGGASKAEVVMKEVIKVVEKIVEVPQSISPEGLRGALARGYCHKLNENKELDSELIEAMALEVEEELKSPTQEPVKEPEAPTQEPMHAKGCVPGKPCVEECPLAPGPSPVKEPEDTTPASDQNDNPKEPEAGGGDL